MSKVADALRHARVLRDLSFHEVEKLSDGEITGTYVKYIERTKATPSPKKLRALCKVYKLDFLDMMVRAGHVSRTDLEG